MPACSPDRWRRTAGAVVLALALPGCVTGHLFAAGRRREYAREIDAPIPDGAGTLVRYTAEVTADDGSSRGTVVRTIHLPPGAPPPAPRDLTRTRTEPWVYPLVPLTLACDVILVPTLVLMSPAILVVGD
jgi:hypothetical protein